MMQMVVGECQGSTSQVAAAAGNTLVNLWATRTSASPQGGGLLAS